MFLAHSLWLSGKIGNFICIWHRLNYGCSLARLIRHNHRGKAHTVYHNGISSSRSGKVRISRAKKCQNLGHTVSIIVDLYKSSKNFHIASSYSPNLDKTLPSNGNIEMMIDNFDNLKHTAHINFLHNFKSNKSQAHTRCNFAIPNTIYKLADRNSKNHSDNRNHHHKADILNPKCKLNNSYYKQCIDLSLNSNLADKPNMLYYFDK